MTGRDTARTRPNAQVSRVRVAASRRVDVCVVGAGPPVSPAPAASFIGAFPTCGWCTTNARLTPDPAVLPGRAPGRSSACSPGGVVDCAPLWWCEWGWASTSGHGRRKEGWWETKKGAADTQGIPGPSASESTNARQDTDGRNGMGQARTGLSVAVIGLAFSLAAAQWPPPPSEQTPASVDGSGVPEWS